MRILVFDLVLVAAALYALRAGGLPERLAALMMAAAAAATIALPFRHGESFHHLEVGELAIDVALLVGLTTLAARADRYWPMWVAMLQLVAIMVHGVRVYDDTILPAVYNRAVGEISYPMLALLVLGTRRHLRRVAEQGGERDWSPLVWM